MTPDEPPSDFDELGRLLQRPLHSPSLRDEDRSALRQALRLLDGLSLQRPSGPASPATPEEEPPNAKGYELWDVLARLRDGSRRVEAATEVVRKSIAESRLAERQGHALLEALDAAIRRIQTDRTRVKETSR